MFIVLYFDDATYCVGPFDDRVDADQAAREQRGVVHEVEAYEPVDPAAGAEWVAA